MSAIDQAGKVNTPVIGSRLASVLSRIDELLSALPSTGVEDEISEIEKGAELITRATERAVAKAAGKEADLIAA